MNPAVRACECFCCAQNSLPHGSPSPCVVSRLEFEQQLDELMEKHKTLQECHSMEKLAAEICSMAESRERLLSEADPRQPGPGREAAGLPAPGRGSSQPGKDVPEEPGGQQCPLFQQENKRATEYLEAASCRHSELQQKFKRLTAELEAQQQESGGAPASMETA
ncbi:synaptonemal complex central element protein 1-like isoform X3 [Eretmochelys imbricata]